jgi:hypothetical protein
MGIVGFAGSRDRASAIVMGLPIAVAKSDGDMILGQVL